MGWFRRGKRDETPPSSPPAFAPLATNAPPDWPPVTEWRTPEGVPEGAAQPMLELCVAATLSRAFNGGGWRVTRLAATRLLDEGVLPFPIEVVDAEGRSVPVVPYLRADDAAGAHFAGVREAAARAGLRPPVYYAPAPLPDRPGASPLVPLAPEHFFKMEKPAPTGQYAMWWRTSGDPSFATSPTRAALDRAYAALDGYEPYLLGALAQQLSLISQPGFVELPEDLTVPVSGPGGVPMLLTASREKGIRFHFPTETTDPAHRNRFWAHFADMAEDLRAAGERAGARRFEGEGSRPLSWWRLTSEVASRPDAQVAILGVIGLK